MYDEMQLVYVIYTFTFPCLYSYLMYYALLAQDLIENVC